MWLLKGDQHRRWRGRLSAYLDGRLQPPERQGLEQHLEGCPSCREELEALRTTVALLRRMPQAPVPRSFSLAEAPAPAVVSWTGRSAAPLRYATAAAGLL